MREGACLLERPVDSLRLWWKSRALHLTGREAVDGDDWFRAVADYLASRAPAGRLPGRQHLDVVELRAYMGFINLIDVLRADAQIRFRFRLMGTAQVEANRRDLTGKFLDDVLSPDDRAWIAERFERVVQLRQPDIANRVLRHAGEHPVHYRRAVFPLAQDGETVDMLLIVHRYLDGIEWCES